MTNMTVFFALLVTTTANAITLCNSDEVTYFSCILEDKQTISICAKDNALPNQGYVQWRLGTKQVVHVIPSGKQPPENVLFVNNYSEKIYNFTSFTLYNNGDLYSAYMGDYGEDHWLEGITIGNHQISCKTPVESAYRLGGFERSLNNGNVTLSNYPFNLMLEAAIKTKLD
jgi:hypothetical protein